MSKKLRKKKQKKKPRRKGSRKPSMGKLQRYTTWEIVLAVLGAAIVVMIAGIVITAILE